MKRNFAGGYYWKDTRIGLHKKSFVFQFLIYINLQTKTGKYFNIFLCNIESSSTNTHTHKNSRLND